MFARTISSTIAIVLATGAAIAQTASPAEIQLAASAGVPPGMYTQAQMIRLIEARRDGNAAEVRFILAQPAAQVSRGSLDPLALSDDATRQLAASAGVPPGRFTAAELVQLDVAVTEDDTETRNFILSGANRRAANPAAVVTPGEAQLAALAGVDPADYTLSELAAMQPANWDN